MVTKDKYTLLKDDYIVLKNKTKLFRIMALRDIVTDKIIVLAGQKGGYVESERNLSQYGNSWIFDGSVVRDNAFVCMDAIIEGKSELCGEVYVSDQARVNSSKLCDNAIVTNTSELKHCAIAGKSNLNSGGYYEGLCTNGMQRYCPVEDVPQYEIVKFDVMER